jgi:hypothetical protein
VSELCLPEVDGILFRKTGAWRALQVAVAAPEKIIDAIGPELSV